MPEEIKGKINFVRIIVSDITMGIVDIYSKTLPLNVNYQVPDKVYPYIYSHKA